MTHFLKGGRRARIAVAAPLTALAVGVASLILTAPAQAGPVADGQGGSTATHAQIWDSIQTAVKHQQSTDKAAAKAAATGTGTGKATGNAVKPDIIGGVGTNINQAKWMVQLVYDLPDGSGLEFCGGTLVAQNKVLTAGHCAAGLDWVKNGHVVGNTGVLFGTSSSMLSNVRSQWLNPSFNGTTIDNDTALLTLDTPFNLPTLPLATPNDSASYAAGTQARVYGWGVTDSAPDSQNLAPTLQSLALPVNSDTTCANELDTDLGDPNAYIAGHMMCGGVGGTGDDSTGKTTCSGDSGGPLVVGGKLIGLVSWGVSDDTQDCNTPGTYDVFTKISTYNGTLQPRINDTDVTRDAKADVIAQTPAGATYVYASTGTNIKTRANAPASFKNYNTVIQADLDRDGFQDYVLRASGTGNAFVGRRSNTSSTYSYTKIGSGWGALKAMLVPGDVTGDGIPDLLTEDSRGRLWIYSGKGDGTFNAAVLTGLTWSQYNLVIGHGDFSGDGITDVLARDSATGNLYLLRGTGNATAPFLAPLLISGGWNGYDKLTTVGDFSGDGKADLLARVPSGSEFLFQGTDAAGSGAFKPSVKIATGWNMYNLLG
ncbi:Repeat domain-containing protein [Streptomyces sp. DvalAA-14]|uniref:trypsin-like serine protease n=1 Tax=unclassified Streptomyces TaxID=2593676 RepID=UPI00081B3DB3|nr:trypsin-like serine protease [Streptomyces sp. DvalAA-14]MYS20785.1 trypsin-like serine protease [Streptomyces sp. SID4948]SCD77067.1 Repeat domain-containing protein [Streptomyces sp. DvalAA-14]